MHEFVAWDCHGLNLQRQNAGDGIMHLRQRRPARFGLILCFGCSPVQG